MSHTASGPKFLTEPPPPRGVAVAVAPGIRRIVANNPGAFTYHGTNTYLIDDDGGTMVIDPGPDDADHVAAIRAAAGRITRIMLTHTHLDHVGALPALRPGLAVHGFAEGTLGDGDRIGDWTAIHTPGHAADHLSFAREDGVVLSGDHIMGWSTTIVSPPDGDMVAYFASLARMLAQGGHTYLPGHGPAITDPAAYTRALRAHREAREAAILAALEAPKDITALTKKVYTGLAPHLLPAAARNVTAHLGKLAAEGRAAETDGIWRAL